MTTAALALAAVLAHAAPPAAPQVAGAAVVLSKRAVEAAVEQTLARALDEAKGGLVVAVVPGAPPVRFVPEAVVESISYAKRDGCACVDLQAGVVGRLVPDVAGVPGLAVPTPRFYVDFTAPLEIALDGAATARAAVVGRARKGASLSAKAEVTGLGPDGDAAATRLLDRELGAALARAQDRRVELFSLGDAALPVRGVDVRVVDRGLALDLDVAVTSKAMADAPAPKGGFSAVLPTATLRALLAAALPHGDGLYAVRDATFDGRALVVDVRRLVRREGHDGERLPTTFAVRVDGGAVVVEDASPATTDAAAALVRAELARALRGALASLVPAGRHDVGGRATVVRATAVRALGAQLVVDAAVE